MHPLTLTWQFKMDARSDQEENLYLTVPVRTLYDACHSLGRDDNGRRCPTCAIRDLCEAQNPRNR